jgi:hypothetical protein
LLYSSEDTQQENQFEDPSSVDSSINMFSEEEYSNVASPADIEIGPVAENITPTSSKKPAREPKSQEKASSSYSYVCSFAIKSCNVV